MALDLSNLSNLLSAAPAGAGVASALAQAAVQKVVFETSLLPPLTWTPSFNQDGTPAPAGSSWNPLSWLRPKITVYPAIGDPYTFAPWGEPGSYFLHALGLLAAVGALVAWFFFNALAIAKTAAVTAAALVAFGILQNGGSR